jgi:hypothetical protein
MQVILKYVLGFIIGIALLLPILQSNFEIFELEPLEGLTIAEKPKFKKESLILATVNVFTQIFNAVPKFGMATDVATNAHDVETKITKQAIAAIKRKEKICRKFI